MEKIDSQYTLLDLDGKMLNTIEASFLTQTKFVFLKIVDHFF